MQRVVLMGEWRVCLKCWRRWRGAVRGKRTRRLMAAAAEELREEKRFGCL